MCEVAVGAWALGGCGTLAVTRIGHGMRGRGQGYVRGARGSTKLADSHGIEFLSIVLVRPLFGVPAPAGVVRYSER
ncbi:hypothetical protein GCM10010207_70400 [Streptomyces atratus]|nr:hypothetical protein GCM10010207_70400 [Streptomyces atratus]